MTDQSLFQEQPKTEETGAQAPVVQPEQSSLFNDQLSMIKNESGEAKYDSVPKALEALQHSQQYIPEIKSQLTAKDTEIAALKEQLAKASTIDEVVDRFTANQGQAPEAIQTSPNALDEQAVIKLMQSHSAQEKQHTIAQANELAVSKVLVDKFGDKALDALSTKAGELGMTTDAMKSLAQQSPQAVIQMFGGGQAVHQPVQSSVSMPMGQPQSVEAQPTKSLLIGATYKDQLSYLNEVRQEVYKKHGITTN